MTNWAGRGWSGQGTLVVVPRTPQRRRAVPLVLLLAATTGLAAPPAASASGAAEESCSPTEEQLPVCEVGDGGLETAAFLDPTAEVEDAEDVALAERVYVAPFAHLDARRGAIAIGPESNVQDSVSVEGGVRGDRSRTRALEAVGLARDAGVETGERVILAHGSSVRGPARIGTGPVLEVEGAAGPEEDSGVFLSFGAQVDGAVLERDTVLSALSRVGPGVVLRSGTVVLPGKSVETQAEADDAALGKVRPITDADRLFNAGVVEVNVGLAREYSRLAGEDADAVRGIGVDPGGNPFDQARDLPTVDSDLCTGAEVADPAFRNRIIGNVCFEDSAEGLDHAMGEHISLRADEGGPFGVGTIEEMDDGVIFHALEGNDLTVGDRVSYGEGVIVHGGGRPQVDPTTGLATPTVVGNDVVLEDGAIVFRSLVRNGAVVGERSAVVGSELEIGQVVPDRTVYANGEVFGPVEW